MAAATEVVLYPFVDFKAIVGEPLYCVAEALDNTDAVSTDAVAFTSSNPAVATINSSTGLFTPLTNGTTTITATAGGASAARIMTVVTPVAGVPIGSAVTRAIVRARIDALSSPGLVKSVDLNYGGNLQNAMNAAVADGSGWTLQLTPGVDYGPVSPPSNRGPLITVTSSGSIPSRGTRMTKARTATYNLPRIWTNTTQSAVSFSNAIRNKNWRFVGVDIGYPVGGTQKLSNYGAFYLPIDVTRLSRIPQDIHLDRCYLRGCPGAYNSRFAFSADGVWVTAIDCDSEDQHYDANVPGAYGTDANYDSQGLRVVYGPGPVYSENCGWQASHECVAYGGGAANIANMVGRDFRLYHCYLNRPPAFKGVYTAKNLWESKQGLFLENEDCVYANIWVDNQNGYCIMLTPTNSGGPDTMRTRDVWIHGAVMETVGGIATMIDQSGLARVTFENIMVRGLDADPETGSPGGNLHVGVAFKILLTAVGISGITLRHITAFNRANNFIEAPNESAGVTYPNFVVEDNNFGEGTNGYGLIRSTSAVEKALWDAIKGTGSRWRNNVGVDVFSGTRPCPANGTTDTNNTYLTAVSAAQLTTPAKATDKTATFTDLTIPVGSIYKGTNNGGTYVTSDGKDPGADMAAIAAWYDNVISGTFADITPPPVTPTYTPRMASQNTVYPVKGNDIEAANISLTGLLQESALSGIVAFAGGGQASATQLTSEVNRISTVASAGDSVKLPASLAGLTVIIINRGANAVQVYGLGTDTVNGVAAATGVSQMPNSTVIYTCGTLGLWETEGLASGFSAGFGAQSFTGALAAFAGGGQASATALPSMVNRVTTVATAADSVKLPATLAGISIGPITVTNAHATNSLNVFPQTGDAINALAANAAFAVAAGKTANFYSTGAGQWHAILSA